MLHCPEMVYDCQKGRPLQIPGETSPTFDTCPLLALRRHRYFAECPLRARTGRSLIRHYGLGALQLYADDCVTCCCNCLGRSRITGATRQWRRSFAVQQVA
jgi:hypothetical protein